MSLSVFGRTGTMSLKMALERLGFGPCYHMDEVFSDPAHVANWEAFEAGRDVAGIRSSRVASPKSTGPVPMSGAI